MSSENTIQIVPATIEDLPQLAELLMDLFEMEGDFEPNYEKQEKGLKNDHRTSKQRKNFSA